MNSQGNWVKIHQVQSNDVDIYIHLEQTDLQNPNLRILSEEGDRIYHHFKVITENTRITSYNVCYTKLLRKSRIK